MPFTRARWRITYKYSTQVEEDGVILHLMLHRKGSLNEREIGKCTKGGKGSPADAVRCKSGDMRPQIVS